jgi:penicillin-binding protein 1B
MRQRFRFLYDHWLYVLLGAGLVGSIYLYSVYSQYARIVDESLETGAFAGTMDIYASSGAGSDFITNLSSQNREKRRLVRFEEIPQTLVNAVLAVEDKRFFQHGALDLRRIVKAGWVNLKAGRKQQGASTISMQLARSLWLQRTKTWGRKWAETLMAIRLENRLSKSEIFELYANQIDLSRHGTFNVHGFGEAARVFFGKDIGKLTLAESATLAGMIQRPSYYSPTRYPERARARRDFVLQLMAGGGYASQTEVDAALNTPLETIPPELDDSQAPYFVDLMKRELEARLPEGIDRKYRVNTTIDMALQHDAVEAVRVGLQEVERRIRGRKDSQSTAGLQVALVALNPHTGEVKALIGGRDYRQSQLNRARVRRQPGSIFKPFVFAAALQTTLRLADAAVTSATILEDAPTSFWFNRRSYEPNNFGDEYYGRVSLRTALVMSINVATVNLAQKIGYPAVVRVAKAAGLTNAQPTPSIALGAYDATALEMAGAWTIFANAGTYVEPHFISTVQDENGATIYTSSPKRIPVIDPRVAYLMVDLLQEVLRSGTGAGVRSRGFFAPAPSSGSVSTTIVICNCRARGLRFRYGPSS